MRRPGWRLACLVLVLSSVGCKPARTTTAIHGEVSYDGHAIEKGRIEFIPIEGTPGPSSGATIKNGHYDIPADKWGVLADGLYQVRVTALRKTGRVEAPPPHMAKLNVTPIEQEENFIPPTYNIHSTLKVRIAELPEKRKADFHLDEKR